MRDCSDYVSARTAQPTANQFDATLEPLLKQYRQKESPIVVSFREIVPWITYNSDRFTHQIHSYPARVIPHIPNLFVNSNLFSQPGQTVADPFCGSGTVLLETILAGRNAVGADINPLARLVAKAKLTPVSSGRMARGYELLHTSNPTPLSIDAAVVNCALWFSQRIQTGISELAARVQSMPGSEVKNAFLVTLSAILRKLSYADPRVSVPVRQNPARYRRGHPFREAATRRLSALNSIAVTDVFEQALEANVSRFEALANYDGSLGKLVCIGEDAMALNSAGIRDQTVTLVLTSPPYLGAQKYIRASEFSLGWLGLAGANELRGLESRSIGREHYKKSELENISETGLPAADRLIRTVAKQNRLRAKIAAQYLIDMRKALEEMYRVLIPGGHLVLVAGANRLCGLTFPTPEYLLGIAREIGFKDRLIIKDHIRSRGLMTRRNTTAGLISTEWVLLLRR